MNRFFSYLLTTLVAISYLTACLCFDSVQAAEARPCPVGEICTEDPSCVVVGDTHMLEWTSARSEKIVVVCIHGLGLCARAYKPLGQQLSGCGIDGFAVNVRGFGPDRDQPERAHLDFIKTVEDVHTFLGRLRKERPDWRIILVGESMGGALAIRIASQYPELVDGVICSAPAWKLQGIKKTAIKGVLELTFLRGSRPGPAGRAVMRQATSDSELAQHWVSDQSHKLKLSLGEARAFLSFVSKTGAYPRRLEKPVIIVQGLNDKLVSANGASILYRSIPASNKTLLIDCKGEHLILEEGQSRQALFEKLLAWIKADSLKESEKKTISLGCERLSRKDKSRLQKLLKKAKSKHSDR